MRQKEIYDKHAKTADVFLEGEWVTFKLKNDDKWVPGTIVRKENDDQPRSYVVKDENGVLYRRNSAHIKSSLNKANKKEIDS